MLRVITYKEQLIIGMMKKELSSLPEKLFKDFLKKLAHGSVPLVIQGKNIKKSGINRKIRFIAALKEL